MITSNFRYFQSFRHFRGAEQEYYRVENGTQVINDSYFLDLSFTYAFANRFFATATLPFVYHERSSMYEHGGNPPNGLGERHHTYAQGLADMRLSAGYWLLDPVKNTKRNLALSLGMKLPTGKYDAKGKFYNQGPDRNETRLLAVDQSIQPGDGGFGATIELQGYQVLSDVLLLNGNFFYLLNPRETNGALTRNGNTEFSVPDQFAALLAVTYLTPLNGLAASIGGRIEGIPAYDLIGGSDGFRRPGYVISAEPGLSYSFGNLLVNASVPISLIRNRTKSYLDREFEKANNQPRHGDAAFADYLINVGVAWRFGGKKQHKMEMHDIETPL